VIAEGLCNSLAEVEVDDTAAAAVAAGLDSAEVGAVIAEGQHNSTAEVEADGILAAAAGLDCAAVGAAVVEVGQQQYLEKGLTKAVTPHS